MENMITELVNWFNVCLEEGNFKKAKVLHRIIDKHTYKIKKGFKFVELCGGKFDGYLIYGEKKLVNGQLDKLGYCR